MIVARYFVVGGTAALIDLSVFSALLKFTEWHWMICASCGFVFATAFNYLLSIYFVFKSGVRFARRHEVSLVFLVSAVGLAMNNLALWLFLAVFGVNIILSKIIATGFVFFWNFGVRHFYIFKGATK